VWQWTTKRLDGADGPPRRLRRASLVTAAVASGLLGQPVAPAGGELPDGRRYELVSPAAKLGSDVIAETSRTRAAAAETPGFPMAVTFASLGGFADTVGGGISTEYLAQRSATPGTSGWTTHAITPRQEPMSLAAAAAQLDPLYEGDMAADLSRAIFRAWSPLTAAPNVAEVENLYVREDLRRPGPGSYRLATDAAALLAPIRLSTERPYLAGASADFEHLIFESRLALTPDASPGNLMLYKSDGGVVRLLADGLACPGSAVAPAAPCSAAGLGAASLRLTTRTISTDGSRVLFTAPVTFSGTISTRASAPSRLHQLDDGGTADPDDDVVLHVNASEKAVPDAPQAARLQAASADGSRVFFTSAEQLTDAPGSGLYLWEREPAPGPGPPRRLTLVGGGASALAIGAAADGRRVYFTSSGPQLVAGGPAVREAGVYLWEDDGGVGALSFAGGIRFGDVAANANGTPWNQIPPVARVTPDGRRLLLTVSDGSGLAPAHDHGSCPGGNVNGTTNGRCSEIYVYRAERSTPLEPELVCVSCRPSGAPATANAHVNAHDGAGASQVTWHLSRALADDGRQVFFSTAEALAPGDANGKVDAYAFDLEGGGAQLISSGRDTADAWFMDASASGDDVFFVTRERLVGWDVDQSYDLYDARVGGGLPEPVPATPACAGDACRGLPRAVPPVPSLGSPLFVGEGNASAGRQGRRGRRGKACRRGFAKKRMKGKRRCVRTRGRGR
jgi:hypothetical protein